MASSLTSSVLNYLIFRYLNASGFTHSSFVFGYEAGIDKSTVEEGLVPPGALITVVQKGLQYLEMEANLNDGDTDLDVDFSFIESLDLITKDPGQLRQMVQEKREALRKDKGAEKEQEGGGGRVTEEERQKKSKGKQPMGVSTSSTSRASRIRGTDVTILKGHSAKVYSCSWSPTDSLLASGSGDSTARIWRISDRSIRSGIRTSVLYATVLQDDKGRPTEKSRDVTTVEWNAEGTRLATGSYDGQTRIWYTYGALCSTLVKHKGPVLSLKWNKKGDSLLTGSSDGTVIVWDVKSAECRQQFAFHSGTILDVDWRNAESFATSFTDTIHVFKIGEPRPTQTFSGHQGEVNCIRWDPSGLILASCSKDSTLKLWNMKDAKCVHDLREHSKEISTIRWSPNNPNHRPLLASASFDSTVKLWDPEAGKLLCSLDGHRGPVHSIAFSPNSEYLASGSWDKSVRIWSVKDQMVIKKYKGDGGIFHVCWNKDGNRIAACAANGIACVLDLRM